MPIRILLALIVVLATVPMAAQSPSDDQAIRYVSRPGTPGLCRATVRPLDSYRTDIATLLAAFAMMSATARGCET